MNNHISHSGLAKLADGSTVNSEAILTYVNGTYTPTIGDGTNNFTTSTADGVYTTYSNGWIYFDLRVSWTSKGSASAASPVYITTPTTAGARSYVVCTGIFENLTFTDQLTARLLASTNQIIYGNEASGGGPPALLVSGCGTTGYVELSGWYK